MYENELGGKVCPLAVPVHRLNWLFRARGGQLSAVFRWMGAEGLPILEDSPDVAPFCYVDGETGEGLLALVNCGLDDQPVSLRFAPELRDLFTGKPAGDILLPPVSARFYLFQS